MIIFEFYRTRKDGVNLFKSYSNQNLYIRKIGTDEVYAEAIDIETAPFQYEETEDTCTEGTIANYGTEI